MFVWGAVCNLDEDEDEDEDKGFHHYFAML